MSGATGGATESYAVIGGEGFVGQALVSKLRETFPNRTTTSLGLTQRHFGNDAQPYNFERTDISSLSSLLAAFSASRPTTVFHTASPHPGSSLEICERVNVEGTRLVIEACRKIGVRKLVFTSSVTVLYEGLDLISVDERLPPTKSIEDHYVATKVRAEKLILDANSDTLLTCSLRLAGVFGSVAHFASAPPSNGLSRTISDILLNRPGDRQILPGLMKVLKDRQTMFQIGDNSTLFDFVHIDNVVSAHILAAEQLGAPPLDPSLLTTRLFNVNLTVRRRAIPTSRDKTSTQVDPPLPARRSVYNQFSDSSAPLVLAGNAVIITNGEPVPFWTFCRAIWFSYSGHIPPFILPLPKALALGLARVAENVAKLTGTEAAMTSVNVRYVTNHLYFDIERVRPCSLDPPALTGLVGETFVGI